MTHLSKQKVIQTRKFVKQDVLSLLVKLSKGQTQFIVQFFNLVQMLLKASRYDNSTKEPLSLRKSTP